MAGRADAVAIEGYQVSVVVELEERRVTGAAGTSRLCRPIGRLLSCVGSVASKESRDLSCCKSPEQERA
jgi:hypothetical protein